MNIGILGGTFDPVHIGHLHIARAAADEYALDRVWLMPAGDPYFKSDKHVTPPWLRLRMAEAAAEDDSIFECCTEEIEDRAATHTAETLTRLCSKYPEHRFFFILGLDSLFQLHKWYRPDIILKKATILCASRDSADYDETFSAIRNRLCELCSDNKPDIRLIHTPELNISSTDIRNKAAAGEDISPYVPGSVRRIIDEFGLYYRA